MKIEAIMVLHQEARADPTGEKAFLLGRQYFISSLRFNSEFMNSDKKYAIKALELNADSIKMGYQKAEEYDELYALWAYKLGYDKNKARKIEIYSKYFKNDKNIELFIKDPVEWVGQAIDRGFQKSNLDI